MPMGPPPRWLDIRSLLPGLRELYRLSTAGSFLEYGAPIVLGSDRRLRLGDFVRGTATQVSIPNCPGRIGTVHTHGAWPHRMHLAVAGDGSERPYMPFGSTDFVSAHASEERISIVVSAGAVIALLRPDQTPPAIAAGTLVAQFDHIWTTEGGRFCDFWVGLRCANWGLCKMLGFHWYLGDLLNAAIELKFAAEEDFYARQ